MFVVCCGVMVDAVCGLFCVPFCCWLLFVILVLVVRSSLFVVCCVLFVICLLLVVVCLVLSVGVCYLLELLCLLKVLFDLRLLFVLFLGGCS